MCIQANIFAMSRVLYSEIDRFTTNYFKGNGNEYADWKERFHQGKRYLPPIRGSCWQPT
jgi:hypothetical protein